MKNDADSFKVMTTPCSVFMTFKTEEGYNRASGLDETCTDNPELAHLNKWCGASQNEGHEIDVQDASEPSDIIWENRQFTPQQRRKKEWICCTVMTIMLLGSFVLIYWCQNVSNNALMKYPVVADCDATLANADDPVFMQNAAILEYRTNSAMEDTGRAVSYQGYVQCFCDARAEAGDEADATYAN